MRIADVLRRKGNLVVTIGPDEPVTALLEALDKHGVGALVVSRGDGSVDGIVSERDVVRHLHSVGREILAGPVGAIMTSEVQTCGLHDATDDLVVTMTERRIRHVPVLEEGRLIGIVSIGDVVKERMEALAAERDHLAAYISS